jgi:hypothetical protein
MLIIALIFPFALMLVAMLLARVEDWVDGSGARSGVRGSPAVDDVDRLRRGEPWAHQVREGAAR